MGSKTAALLTILVTLGCLSGLAQADIVYTVDFSDAEKYMAVDAWGRPRGTDTAKYQFMRKIIAKAASWLSTTFNGNGLGSTISFTSFKAPFSGRSVGAKSTYSANIYVYADFYSDSDNQIMTYGKIHQTDTTSGRPIAGSISVNLPLVTISPRNTYHYFPIVMFDLYKIMVFDKSLFGSFRDGSTVLNKNTIVKDITIDGKSYSHLIADQGSSFLTGAKAIYNNDLQGVMMEESSDDYYGGNSFEKSLYPNDWLNPTEEIPCLLTTLSANIAVASGWFTRTSAESYQPIYVGLTPVTHAQNTAFGTKKCLDNTMDGYCSEDGKRSCSPDGKYKVICKKDAFSGDCFYQGGTDYCFIDDEQGDKKDWEYYGANSRCVMIKDGSSTYPACLKVTAISGAGATLKTKGDTTTFTCSDLNSGTSSTSDKTTETSAQIDCGLVLTELAASDSSKCTNDCNGNGICLNDGSTTDSGSCFCFWGWTGSECSTDNAQEGSLLPISPFVDGIVRLDNANLLGSVMGILALVSALLL